LQSFLSCERNIHAGVTPLSFLQSFFPKKRRSSRDNGAARQSAFFAKLSFSRKKAEWGDRQTGFAGRQTAAPYGLPGWSFHGVTGFCSSSAHPRNFCCIGFARM